MKTCCLILVALWSCVAFGQGNNCTNAHSLTLDAVCRSFPVSTASASCDFCSYSGSTGKVTYFRFTTDNAPQCVLVDVTASSVVTMEMVLYSACTSGTPSPAGGLYNHGMCMDQGKGLWAQNLFDNLAPNTSYYLRVRTQNGFTGNLQVCAKYYTPPNDQCSGAASIGMIPVSDNNACETPDLSIPPAQLCAITLENTAWYTYVAQYNGSSTITIDNISCNNGNGNNSNGFQIGFFTGTCGSLTPLTCATAAGGTISATAYGLTAGSRVYVAVDGYSGSNCSYRIAATNAEPLPVQLKEFSGWRSASKNILKWVTVEEIDNDYFELQRSEDGRSFYPIGKVAGHGDSHDEKQYQFEDERPALRSYYRLKQVDFDGKYSYSKVIEISRADQPYLEMLTAYTLQDQLNLSFKSSHKAKLQLRIIDTQGRVLKTEWINCESGITQYSRNVSNLPMGQYYAVVMYEREKLVRSFVKGGSVH